MDYFAPSVSLGFSRLLDHLNVTIKNLQSPSRQQGLSNKRKVVAYVLKARSSLTLHEIARVFQRTDHTTAIYWIRWVESSAKTNPHFQRMLEDCLMCYDTEETTTLTHADIQEAEEAAIRA